MSRKPKIIVEPHAWNVYIGKKCVGDFFYVPVSVGADVCSPDRPYLAQRYANRQHNKLATFKSQAAAVRWIISNKKEPK